MCIRDRLKEHEDEIEGTVKLEFQPAEEIFQGSLDMISSGLLENPKVCLLYTSCTRAWWARVMFSAAARFSTLK